LEKDFLSVRKTAMQLDNNIAAHVIRYAVMLGTPNGHRIPKHKQNPASTKKQQ
jgi:hypothetical protein